MQSAHDVFERYKLEINTHDFDRLEPLISADCQFWFSSGTHQGLAEARAAFERTWGMIREEVYRVSSVKWLNESACTYTFHWSGLIDGQRREGTGRGTSCFREEAGGWKLVHEHLSAFPA
jgi:ketosteroid isomerase-like protein